MAISLDCARIWGRKDQKVMINEVYDEAYYLKRLENCELRGESLSPSKWSSEINCTFKVTC